MYAKGNQIPGLAVVPHKRASGLLPPPPPGYTGSLPASRPRGKTPIPPPP
jgi:hypothetical protein